ncbi:MarR family winged helix-turn-helix transcriptional regulator [Methylomarinum sp. Ch1-1]|uniref:MarR family winged helix-turn-helix transcriptional regulator n=1 Tax=Methylomarinum roseum TaxID=3067653 RepID=A0AAU7NWL8_9GAMM|nr:MarR family winged helix-turn-helix transcriptional regulator [Methylomarinum sp. Ch1-1]MDP4522592.1 MarR family winged helix-turn-helix transcriptional regulator [Methylomarinum sp. Ch1-1]
MHELNTFKLIERISTLVRSEERKRYAAIGLQPVHGQVLEYLAKCNRYSDTPAAVTEYLGSTKGTVSQSIQVLERKNYIEKVPDTEDRRVVHLVLTEAGLELINGLQPLEIFDQAEQQVSAQQFESIDDALNVTLSALQAANHSKSFGLCRTCRFFGERENHFHCELTQSPLEQADTEKLCREHLPC